MKTVLVGGSGFIGSHIVDILLKDGWQVTVYDRSLERFRPPLPNVQYVIGELGNTGLLNTVLTGSDVVFHLASTTIPQSSNESPAFDIQSNLISTIGLLDICVQCRVKKIVFISSGGTVYGIPDKTPVTEDQPTNPISSYGIIKLTIEKYLQLYEHLYGLEYTILRPSNPFGERQNPAGRQGVVAVFMGRIAQNQPLVLWGNGGVVRDYLHVTDLARAAVLAAVSTTQSHIFNIGSGKGISLNALIDVMKSVIDKPISIMRMPSRPFDVPAIVLDASRAKNELNWQPRVALEDGIATTWEWAQSMTWLRNE